jgi:hypothetical protein
MFSRRSLSDAVVLYVMLCSLVDRRVCLPIYTASHLNAVIFTSQRIEVHFLEKFCLEIKLYSWD